MLLLLVAFLEINVILAKECNILNYGAKGDGKTNDTKAIQNAIDDCNSEYNNIVLFPYGYTFSTYSFQIKYNYTTLIIDGIISVPNDADLWPKSSSGRCMSLITSQKYLTNITISGNGLINGNGQIWWEGFKNGSIDSRPWLIELYHLYNVNISYINLIDAPCFLYLLVNQKM